MGISSLSDVSSNSGLLITVIIVAGVSVASIKQMFASILQVLGFISSEPQGMESTLGLDLGLGSGSYHARLLLIAELDGRTSKSPLPHDFGNDADCVVCLSKVDDGVDQIRKLPCSHVFHKSCIDEWLEYGQQAACPLCRSSILSEETAMKMKQQLTEELIML